jgi:hypothetical protein
MLSRVYRLILTAHIMKFRAYAGRRAAGMAVARGGVVAGG